MTTRIPVKDTTLGTTNYMWTVDAEEAVRYDPTRHIPQVPTQQLPPKKNPGGRGN